LDESGVDVSLRGGVVGPHLVGDEVVLRCISTGGKAFLLEE